MRGSLFYDVNHGCRYSSGHISGGISQVRSRFLKTLDDSEMASPESAKWVLLVIREAFACPQYCVKVTDDRHPCITLLLLEHLNEITGGKMRADIEEVKRFTLGATINGIAAGLHNTG